MIKVIGVRFRTAGKVYFFDPLEFDIKRGDHVIVETARGIEYGTVVSGVHEVEDDKVIQPLKPVIRIASERDVEQEAANKLKEREAYKICLEKIRKHELEMKLIDAEYTFDNNKVLFYFTADGRIDFRELVKDLAAVFKTRIELRQIGVRDETKIMGGIGICGRPLCCHSYLSDFVPVSIKMAKEQNLSLNPTKISGVCGRLMCCLKNEEETYEELNRRLPNIGDFVTTDDGLKGEVQSVNVLRQIVKVVVENNDEKEIRDYEVDRLQFKRKHNRKEKLELSQEEMKELERLEKEEFQEEVEAKPERRNNRRNDRNDTKNDNDNGNISDRSDRADNRNDNPNGSRNDNRSDAVQERQSDRRNGEGRQNRRFDKRNHDNKTSAPVNAQTGNNAETQPNVANENKNKSESGQERRNDRRNNNRGEGRQNRRFDKKNRENRTDAPVAQTSNNAENQQSSANENRGDGHQGRRYDNRPRRRDRNDRKEGRKPESNDN